MIVWIAAYALAFQRCSRRCWRLPGKCAVPTGLGCLRSVLPARSPHLQPPRTFRSEEHTSELQSHSDLVCRLLLEKKKKKKKYTQYEDRRKTVTNDTNR